MKPAVSPPPKPNAKLANSNCAHSGNVNAQPPPTCPRCQLSLRSPVSLVRHLRTSGSTRTTPAAVPTSTSVSPSTPTTDSDRTPEPPLPSSSSIAQYPPRRLLYPSPPLHTILTHQQTSTLPLHQQTQRCRLYPYLSSLRPHFNLTHRPGRSLANPPYRDRRTSALSTNLRSPRSSPLSTLPTQIHSPHGSIHSHAHSRQPPATPHHHTLPHLHHRSSSTTSIQLPPLTQVGSVRLGSVARMYV
ncbi:hypothetical protein SprV_0802512200 [Sparganum proliferum]